MPWSNGTWTDYETPNVTSFEQLAVYNNSISNDLFGLGLVLIIFFVLFTAMSYTRSRVALQSSLFITTMIAFLLTVPGIVGLWVGMIFLVGTVGSIIIMFKNEGGYSGI